MCPRHRRRRVTARNNQQPNPWRIQSLKTPSPRPTTVQKSSQNRNRQKLRQRHHHHHRRPSRGRPNDRSLPPLRHRARLRRHGGRRGPSPCRQAPPRAARIGRRCPCLLRRGRRATSAATTRCGHRSPRHAARAAAQTCPRAVVMPWWWAAGPPGATLHRPTVRLRRGTPCRSPSQTLPRHQRGHHRPRGGLLRAAPTGPTPRSCAGTALRPRRHLRPVAGVRVTAVGAMTMRAAKNHRAGAGESLQQLPPHRARTTATVIPRPPPRGGRGALPRARVRHHPRRRCARRPRRPRNPKGPGPRENRHRPRRSAISVRNRSRGTMGTGLRPHHSPGSRRPARCSTSTNSGARRRRDPAHDRRDAAHRCQQRQRKQHRLRRHQRQEQQQKQQQKQRQEQRQEQQNQHFHHHQQQQQKQLRRRSSGSRRLRAAVCRGPDAARRSGICPRHGGVAGERRSRRWTIYATRVIRSGRDPHTRHPAAARHGRALRAARVPRSRSPN
jgi:hypothetical protein